MTQGIDPKWVRDQATFELEARRATWKMSRLRHAAKLIPAGATVLDFGCGSMLLKDFLPTTCTYIPADLYAARDSRIIPVDMNAGEFPKGRFDIVVMLAVLFAANDPAKVLSQAAEHTDWLLLTAGEELGKPVVAAFGRPVSFPALDQSGWKINKTATIPLPVRRLFDPNHKLLLCSRVL